MATAKPRVKVPKKASAGEVITIKTLISHNMESGQRKDKEGNVIPRKIINKFVCYFNDTIVFSCDIDPAVSANPYIQFNVKMAESGTFKFEWTEDGGEVFSLEKAITVE